MNGHSRTNDGELATAEWVDWCDTPVQYSMLMTAWLTSMPSPSTVLQPRAWAVTVVG